MEESKRKNLRFKPYLGLRTDIKQQKTEIIRKKSKKVFIQQ